MTLKPSLSHLPLQWGHCRLRRSLGENDKEWNRQRRRQRRHTTEKSPWMPPHGTQAVVALFHTGHGVDKEQCIILCRWRSTSSFFSADNEDQKQIVCLDDSVRVLFRTKKGVDISVHTALDVWRSPSVVPWRTIAKRLNDSDKQRCVCSEAPEHSHILVGPTLSNWESASDSVEHDSPHGIFSLVRQVPSPLLSISLSKHETSTDRNRAVSSFKAEKDCVLRQACHKRELVGSIVMFNDSNADYTMTTQFAIPSSNGVKERYEVASLVPQQKSDKNTNFYIVMPSTRITIFEVGDMTMTPNACKSVEESRDEGSKPNPTSSAATILLDTIRCARRLASRKHINVPRSFLLTGPPGVGKTHAVRSALMEIGRQHAGSTKLVSIQGSELLGAEQHYAESASRTLEQHFLTAVQFCEEDKENHVALVFLDECEALLSSAAVASMLGYLLDRVSSFSHSGWRHILVVAATNRIDAVPTWLRRPGRFDREVVMAPPNASERLVILESLLRQQSQQDDESVRDIMNERNQSSTEKQSAPINRKDLVAVAEACVGYVAADLAALVRRSTLLGIQEHFGHVTADLLKRSVADVGASALRDAALAAPPTTSWDDIAGDAGGAKSALRRAVEWPRTKREAFTSLGLVPPRGILLHGPPGCAKTTLARAAAGASGIAFFSLSPADVYASSYVGEAESVVRRAFTLARSAAPCILFFDEIDSILGGESGGGMQGRGASAEARVLSTFLNEMDGVDGSSADGVLVLGATNRPSTVDAALLRPGRFDKVIYVPPPDMEGRRSILNMQCNKWAARCATNDLEKPFDFDVLASDSVTGHLTGAEIVGACREAAMRSLRDALVHTSRKGETEKANDEMPVVTHKRLEESLMAVKPLLFDDKALQEYEQFATRHHTG